MSVRVLVLVLSVDREPWRSIEIYGQRRTWARSDDPASTEAPTLFYYGSRGSLYWTVGAALRGFRLLGARRAKSTMLRWVGSRTSIRPSIEEGDCLNTQVPEAFGNVTAKMLAAFRHVLATREFDFIFRTNTSSYVHRGRLLRFAETRPRREYYGGPINYSDGVRYATGSGILISRDLVEAIVTELGWDYDCVDDLALGRSMERFGMEVEGVPRVDVPSPSHLERVNRDELSNSFLVRCYGEGDRSHDIATMLRVHAAYESLDRNRYGGQGRVA